MSEVWSRQSIAESARAAARHWVDNPRHPRPENPFDLNVQPDHYREWKAAFERHLVQFSAPDAEASA